MPAVLLILAISVGIGLAAHRLRGWWEPLLVTGILAAAYLQFTFFGPS